jgi:hypothetical protein
MSNEYLYDPHIGSCNCPICQPLLYADGMGSLPASYPRYPRYDPPLAPWEREPAGNAGRVSRETQVTDLDNASFAYFLSDPSVKSFKLTV